MPTLRSHAEPPTWFKSSYSGGNTTECLECARVGQATFVRDSKRPEGPVLTVRDEPWRVFVGAATLSGFHEAD
ncbi:DUF397 domain-containing protein [Streptomyces sp. NPDC049597]|uniref:DUF397 domain-containing protein n=1 Tax=Streptomyces sp. NPDC049597 TaxID=3155276 RepID=UPI00342789AF